ncbi:MAG: hypothetical protein L6R41_006543, partial [Letrouitia leprolyta]
MSSIPVLITLESLPNEVFARQGDVFESTFRNSPNRQFANMAWLIMTSRYVHILESGEPYIQTPDDFDNVFDAMNENNSDEIEIDDDDLIDNLNDNDSHDNDKNNDEDEDTTETPVIYHPIFALDDIAFLYHDTDIFTTAFVQSRCRQPLRQSQPPQQTFNTQIVLSPTELHRIHRALWRFWTICEISYRKSTTTQGWHDRQAELAVHYFLGELKAWELEELECIVYFMQELYRQQLVWVESPSPLSTLIPSPSSPTVHPRSPATIMPGLQKIPAPFHLQPLLLQRLLCTIGHTSPTIPPPQNLDFKSGDLRFFLSCARANFEFSAPRLSWPDAPPEAARANEGWLCWERNSGPVPRYNVQGGTVNGSGAASNNG